MVGLKNETTQVYPSEFDAFDSYTFFIYILHITFPKRKIMKQQYYSDKIFKNKNSNQISIHTALCILKQQFILMAAFINKFVFLLRHWSSPKAFKIKSFSVKHNLHKYDIALL